VRTCDCCQESDTDDDTLGFCMSCGLCEWCCDCEDFVDDCLFDADELGLDPELDDERRYPGA